MPLALSMNPGGHSHPLRHDKVVTGQTSFLVRQVFVHDERHDDQTFPSAQIVSFAKIETFDNTLKDVPTFMNNTMISSRCKGHYRVMKLICQWMFDSMRVNLLRKIIHFNHHST